MTRNVENTTNIFAQKATNIKFIGNYCVIITKMPLLDDNIVRYQKRGSLHRKSVILYGFFACSHVLEIVRHYVSTVMQFLLQTVGSGGIAPTS